MFHFLYIQCLQVPLDILKAENTKGNYFQRHFVDKQEKQRWQINSVRPWIPLNKANPPPLQRNSIVWSEAFIQATPGTHTEGETLHQYWKQCTAPLHHGVINLTLYNAGETHCLFKHDSKRCWWTFQYLCLHSYSQHLQSADRQKTMCSSLRPPWTLKAKLTKNDIWAKQRSSILLLMALDQ